MGDSGGPLLVRMSDGRVGVLGSLRAGAASCAGVDLFERLDTVAAWLAQRVESPPAEPPTCGTLDGEGRCFDTLAVWCGKNGLESEICSADSPCGWSDAASGYRCVADDPCRGVGDRGACADDSSRLSCEHGVLVTTACGACGACSLGRDDALADCRAESENDLSR